MTLEQMRAEMDRKPDPHLLLEWIEEQIPHSTIAAVINEYFVGLDAGVTS